MLHPLLRGVSKYFQRRLAVPLLKRIWFRTLKIKVIMYFYLNFSMIDRISKPSWILTITDVQIGTEIIILIVFYIIIRFGVSWERWVYRWLNWWNARSTMNRRYLKWITKMIISMIICTWLFSRLDMILIVIYGFLSRLKW